MKFLNKPQNFDFMGKRKLATILSLTLIVISVFSLATRGLHLGIDFTGGTLIELGYQEDADLDSIRADLSASELGDAVVPYFASSRAVLIRLAPTEGLSSAELSTRVLEILKGPEMRRVEFVGPQVGDELTEDGGLAILYALIGILIYVTLRFESRFSVGSVAALVHDVMIVLGCFSLFQFEFNLPVLAAILAVIGYSLNDTIVVFDRIRENFRKMRKGTSIEIINVSLNETLSRTIITSLTTLLVLMALFLFGGELIHAFSITLIIGVIVGTYSSIYVASTTTLAMGVSKEDLMPVKKEGESIDDRP